MNLTEGMFNIEHTTDKIKRRYNRIAKLYDFFENPMEMAGLDKWRRLLWRDAGGRVLEAGVGTGKNIPFYPSEAEVTGIDFSTGMLQKARNRATKLGISLDLREMDIQSMKYPDNTFDMIIASCVFCSVPDPIKGLKEIRRVLKPGGKLLLLEHVKSKRPILGFIMDCFNPVPLFLYGANINRETVENITASGFHIKSEENLMLDIVKFIKAEKEEDYSVY